MSGFYIILSNNMDGWKLHTLEILLGNMTGNRYHPAHIRKVAEKMLIGATTWKIPKSDLVNYPTRNHPFTIVDSINVIGSDENLAYQSGGFPAIS